MARVVDANFDKHLNIAEGHMEPSTIPSTSTMTIQVKCPYRPHCKEAATNALTIND